MKDLASHAGPVLREAPDGSLRLAWGEPDWLGPVARPPGTASAFEGSDALGAFRAIRHLDEATGVESSVRAYADVARSGEDAATPAFVFRTAATRALTGLATGAFARPSFAWPAFVPQARAPGGVPSGTRTYGHQYTEFALPVNGDDAGRGFTFAGHRPPVVEPYCFIAPDHRTLLLAPVVGVHEAIVAVPKDDAEAALGVRCGWHGDLDSVPAGFATEIALFAAAGPRAALDALGALLLRRAGLARPSRYADDGVGKLSYWTDNGSVYYYRTEPGEDYTTTLERTVVALREAGVPIASVQLDSWFYPHETLRPVSAEGAAVVPPTGMMRWEPREDLFPEGFARLRERLGGLPLTFHSRHFSTKSPYWSGHAAHMDASFAHPVDDGLHTEMMEHAAGWGAITYEQDWLVESFLGVRGLREAPGRARAWQQGMDRAARDRGLTLQWCMATPADFLATPELTQVTSIRTSGDYRYLFDNGLNWVWFLHGNALARALGLHPYKDVFLTHGETGLGPGERYAEAEALLAALSAGPVGIGDRRGHTDPALVLRTCRADGVLVKPDLPLAAVDRCFRQNAFLEAAPLVAETVSCHRAGRFVYVLVMNACRKKERLAGEIPLTDLGASAPDGPVVAYDWRSGRAARVAPDESLPFDLAWQDFAYTVLCPILPSGLSVFGDVSKYACAGDRRMSELTALRDGARFDVWGAPAEAVEISGAAPRTPRASAWSAAGDASAAAVDAGDGRFVVRVRLGAMGSARVTLAL